jgi:hypothetical protein
MYQYLWLKQDTTFSTARGANISANATLLPEQLQQSATKPAAWMSLRCTIILASGEVGK